MGKKFIDWDEFDYHLLALLFNSLAIKNLVTVFTLGTNLPFSSKTARVWKVGHMSSNLSKGQLLYVVKAH